MSGKTVLVIDDEEYLATAIQDALVDHTVTIETSGKLALERLRSGNTFDLILCDLSIPDLSGMEIFKAITIERPEQAKRVIFLTGGATTPEAENFLKAIANPCIEKPFSMKTILSFLEDSPPHPHDSPES